MQHDLQRIDDDQHLRHWLKAQQPSRDAPELADILDLAMFVGRPPRRR
jgi:hypothetical protein